MGVDKWCVCRVRRVCARWSVSTRPGAAQAAWRLLSFSVSMFPIKTLDVTSKLRLLSSHVMARGAQTQVRAEVNNVGT